MANALEPEGLGFSIPATSAPNDEQREFMQGRIREIDRALHPAPEAAALSEIAAVLRTMVIRSGDGGELEAVIRIYMGDLADVPLFALTTACKAFRRGDAGKGTFAPTPAELRKEALRHVVPLSEERGRLLRILDARVQAPPTPTDESKKAAALAHMQETARIINEKSRPVSTVKGDNRPLTANEAAAWLEREQANPSPLPPLSESLQRNLGIVQETPGHEDQHGGAREQR